MNELGVEGDVFFTFKVSNFLSKVEAMISDPSSAMLYIIINIYFRFILRLHPYLLVEMLTN